jgi:hypothetical protein
MHHQVGQYQVGEGDHLPTPIRVACTLELHENIITELLNFAPTLLALVYMVHEAQLSTSNGANVLVSSAFSLNSQGVHSCNLGIQAPIEVFGEVCVINQNIIYLRDFILLYVFLIGWNFECCVFLGFMFVGWRISTARRS